MGIGSGHRIVTAALACGAAAVFCVSPGASTASAATADINVTPVIPGENLGGDLVYDGFDDRDISRFGIYGMAYHLETLNQKDCAAAAKKTTGQIDAFDTTGNSNVFYLREKGEFEPTGPSVTLQPSDELSVSSSKSEKKYWSISVAVENELGNSWIGKLKVTVTGTYGQEVETTNTDTATARNPTSDMVQERAYGIYSDVWAVQVRSWRVAWYKAGSQIFVGDDTQNMANLYQVKDAGCYRTGYFSTITVARSKGQGVVRQYPVGSTSAGCSYRITSDDVELYPGTKDGTEPDENGEKVSITDGTCVTLSGRSPVGAGESNWVQLAKVKTTNGRCPVSTKQLCKSNYWVRSTDISEMNIQPAPLVKWGTGTQFTIRPVGLPNNKLSSAGSDNRYYVYWNSSTHSDTWKLVNKRDQASKGGAEWQLVNVGGDAGGRCLQDNGEVYTAACSANRDLLWRVTFAGDGTFYLNTVNSNECATAAGDAIVKLFGCRSTATSQQWSLVKS